MIKKLAQVVCFLIILGSSAVAGYSQTATDPKAVINAISDAACDSEPLGCITANSASDPLTVPFSDPLSTGFVWDGTGDLDVLYLEYTDVPLATPFECESDIWTMCSETVYDESTYDDVVFMLSGSGSEGCYSTSPCPGFLAPTDAASITNTPLVGETPEPASAILFGTGLISFFIIAKRRFHGRSLG
jgi:hypothetical protein